MSEQSKYNRPAERVAVKKAVSHQLASMLEDWLAENIEDVLTCYPDGFLVDNVITDVGDAVRWWAAANMGDATLRNMIEPCLEPYLDDDYEV